MMMRAAIFLASTLSAIAGPLVEQSGQKNIVQLASSQHDLSTLVAALSAGGLTEALSGTGPR